MDKPSGPEFYDRMFEKGGHEGAYALPVRHCPYYPLFRRVVKELAALPAGPLLEVGCGTGGLAELLLEKSYLYNGFDFSQVAIEEAVRRTGRKECFRVGDALDESSYDCDYTTIICTEVLEHIEDDLEVVSLWRRGTQCICSVPNFDSASHVRVFRDKADVSDRYGALIAIRRVFAVKRPFLSDISLRNRVSHLVWHRRNPRRLLRILGAGSFEETGGWFLFVGQRR